MCRHFRSALRRLFFASSMVEEYQRAMGRMVTVRVFIGAKSLMMAVSELKVKVKVPENNSDLEKLSANAHEPRDLKFRYFIVFLLKGGFVIRILSKNHCFLLKSDLGYDRSYAWQR